MISFCHPYHNACCDGCGRMLPAEYSEDAALSAAKRVGWIERGGKLLCGPCQTLGKTGKTGKTAGAS